MNFTPEEVQFFRVNGYVAGPRVLSDEQIERLRQRMDGIFGGQVEFPDELRGVADSAVKNNPKLNKLANVFRHDSVFSEMIGNSAVSSLARDLLTPPVRVWEDQAIAKAPGDPHGVVAWHRDYTYWDHVGPPELATCWIALDDATSDNGCMYVIPGSQRWALNFRREEVDNDDPDWVLKHTDIPPAASREPVSCEVKAGHCHFHHCLLLHGSPGNSTDRPRRSYILHLMPGNIRRLGDSWNPRMAKVEEVEVGETIKGPSYPELV